MIRRKKVLILVTFVALLLLLLSQCTGSPANRPSGPNDGGTSVGKTGKNPDNEAALSGKSLRVSVSLDAIAFASLKKQSAEFAAAHGGMTITLDNVPEKDAYATWKKTSQLGEAPDLMLLDNNEVNEFAALGYLQPVDELFTTEMQAQRIPIVLSQVKWNGYLWGVPHDVDPYIIVWNKKTADGIKRDHAPESAEEMLQWNQAFSRPEEGRYGIYFLPSSSESFIAVTSALTGIWLDPAQTANKWVEPSAIKTIESFLSPPGIAAKKKATLFPAPSESWDPWDQLQKGKIAAMVSSFSAYRQHATADLAIASLPTTYTDAQGNYVWLQGHSFVLSSRSTNQTAAMEWIKEMSTADAAAKMWADAKQLPALIPALNSPAIRGDEYAKSYEWLLGHAIVLPAHPETDKKLLATQAELQKLLKGEQDAKTFAGKMAGVWVPAAK